jgi:hypothetical protein
VSLSNTYKASRIGKSSKSNRAIIISPFRSELAFPYFDEKSLVKKKLTRKEIKVGDIVEGTRVYFSFTLLSFITVTIHSLRKST